MCPFPYILVAIAVISVTVYLFRRSHWSCNARTLDCAQLAKVLKESGSVHPSRFLSGGHVTKAELEMLLDASSWVPADLAGISWRYVVLTGPDTIRRYLDLLPPARDDDDQTDSATFARLDVEQDLRANAGRMSHLVLITSTREGGETQQAAVARAVGNAVVLAKAMGVGVFHCRKAWECEGMGEGLAQKLEGHFGIGFWAVGRLQKGEKTVGLNKRVSTSVTFVKT